jgi:hypothetical protein
MNRETGYFILIILTRIEHFVTADETGGEIFHQHFGWFEFLQNVVDSVLTAPFQRLVVFFFQRQ